MRKIIGVVCVIVCIGMSLCGCESLVRKFTRKSTTPTKPREILLEPQEYGTQKPDSQALYDQYFLYWKSWHDEFADSLSSAGHKHQADTAKEALENLTQMRRLLDEKMQQKLDGYIRRFEQLKDTVEADAYGMRTADHVAEAESIKRGTMSDFAPARVKSHLVSK